MLEKNYDPAKSEKKWQEFWVKEGIYRFDPESGKKIFSIDTPPPTISGKMHIGHAFSYSQMDFIARYRRMRGENVLYPFGTDDNGLPTERLIEKENKVRSADMERKEFIELCMKTLERIRPKYIQDWKAIGLSADWDVFYSTINEHCRKISQLSFIELYKKGRIYRKKAPFVWCPECRTSIAQVEMEDCEKDSNLVYIRLETDKGKPITIATTRPEFMAACVGIYVNPKDKRYSGFVGAKAMLPIYGREVEIMPNPDVDMEFGTGVVYHCTFGDLSDAEWAQKMNTDIIEILNKDGTLNEKAGKYSGMKVPEARKNIIKDLENMGAVEKTEPVKHIVNVHDKCGTPLEILTTEQWFIKYLDIKDELANAGRKIKWHPEHMFSRYSNWAGGLKWDWCISRQRYFGVPFPLWYCKKCGQVVLADEKQLPVDPLSDSPSKSCKCGSRDFVPEKDVLDTWATSSMTPQIVSELFRNTPVFEKVYPMDLRPQAHDIISFWLFNTVVKSVLHKRQVPWKNIMISGWALDPKGKKMSKSKGNVVEPKEVLEKNSADILRFWCASSKLGEDLSFQEKILVTGDKTIKKLWNASRFAIMNLGDYKPVKGQKPETAADKWLMSRLSCMIEKCTDAFENYEYSRAKKEVEMFFWHDFADNYLEMAKDRIYNPNDYAGKEVDSAKYTLYTALLSVIKVFAPIIPHVTEEIYQGYFRQFEKSESIHVSNWPVPAKRHEKEEKQGDMAVEIISSLRKYKTEKGMSMNQPIKKVVVDCREIGPLLNDIKKTMKIGDISVGSAGGIIKTESGIMMDVVE